MPEPLPPSGVTLPEPVVDPFASPAYPVPAQTRPSSMIERTQWIRDEVPVVVPSTLRDPELAIEVILGAEESPVEDVRVVLWSPTSIVASFRVPSVPPGATVRVDFTSERVYTTAPGQAEQVNGAWARDYDGGPLRWPGAIPAGQPYILTVDRAPHSKPVMVAVSVVGRRI